MNQKKHIPYRLPKYWISHWENEQSSSEKSKIVDFPSFKPLCFFIDVPICFSYICPCCSIYIYCPILCIYFPMLSNLLSTNQHHHSPPSLPPPPPISKHRRTHRCARRASSWSVGEYNMCLKHTNIVLYII